MCDMAVDSIIGLNLSLFPHPTPHNLAARLGKANSRILDLESANESITKENSKGIAELKKECAELKSKLRWCDMSIINIIGLNLSLVPPIYPQSRSPTWQSQHKKRSGKIQDRDI